MTVYGYARVSTRGQSLQPQRLALREAGAGVLVEEKASGTLTERPALDGLLARVADGDQIIVWRLDRLGRSLPHLVATVEGLAARGVAVRSLHEQIDTTTANGRLLLGFFATLAQFERDLVSERTKTGLAAARRAGRVPGRPRALDADKARAADSLRRDGQSHAAIARSLGVSKSTITRHFQRVDASAGTSAGTTPDALDEPVVELVQTRGTRVS